MPLRPIETRGVVTRTKRLSTWFQVDRRCHSLYPHDFHQHHVFRTSKWFAKLRTQETELPAVLLWSFMHVSPDMSRVDAEHTHRMELERPYGRVGGRSGRSFGQIENRSRLLYNLLREAGILEGQGLNFLPTPSSVNKRRASPSCRTGRRSLLEDKFVSSRRERRPVLHDYWRVFYRRPPQNIK